uniref:Capsid protein n=1 Tax=Alphatorquevirus homin9 TaxID=3048433 RepID=A0AAU7SSS5_9VIRU
MAWGWWKRRRKWWWRRRWTRGRFRKRRPRRAGRRPRRRRVRRRRAWRRGRRKRRTFRRRRRRKGRRHRAKLIIRQWQPEIVRKCLIIGYFPMIICGQGRWSENYSSHLEDRVAKYPFGGGHATTRWSLKVLYEENLRHLNFWTWSNRDLELARYIKVTWIFYRHQDVDFIVYFNRKSPMGGNIYTAPMMHPGALMLSKHKILVKSYKTKPKGKPTVKVTIKPPTLLVDKWYFQKDICDMTLLNINAVAADLRFPFCSPQTDNPCVNFLVLSTVYNNFLSIAPNDLSPVTEDGTAYYKKFLDAAFKKDRDANALNTFRTQSNFSHPPLTLPQASTNTTNHQYFNTLDGYWGDPIYVRPNDSTVKPTQTLDKVKCIITDNMKNWHKKVYNEGISKLSHSVFAHNVGIFSSTFLSAGRLATEVTGLYTDVIYNPYTDKGKGNMIWVDYCQKKDNIYSETQSKCLIANLPLWMACNGYVDWVKKETDNWVINTQARVLIVTPYTYPKLYREDNPQFGYVAYSFNFGDGKMPNGSTYIPFLYRNKWYPIILHQQSVLEDIARSGPFALKQQMPSATLTAKYKFKFLFGGNPTSEQVVRDPCTQPTFELPGASTQPPRIQVTDPKLLGPHYSFHSWDLRRGYYSTKSLKRMSEHEEPSEFIFPGPKKPRVDLGPIQEQERPSDSLQRESRPWETSEEESEAEVQQEETEEVPVREQLLHNLREQQQLRKGLQCVFQQLIKTQQGVHIDPSLL